MKPALILALLLALAACSQGQVEQVSVTILDHHYTDALMGCVGTNWETSVIDEKQRLGSWCGKWGEPGMRVTGYYRTGHWDPPQNGLYRVDPRR